MEPTIRTIGEDLLAVLNAAPTDTVPVTPNSSGYRVGRIAAETLFLLRGERIPNTPEQQLQPETNNTHRALVLGTALNAAHAINGLSPEDLAAVSRIRTKILANFNAEVGRSNPSAPTRHTETQRIYERLYSL